MQQIRRPTKRNNIERSTARRSIEVRSTTNESHLISIHEARGMSANI
jgi:hypothetical protein